MTTRARTWLLVAGLTALLIAIGVLIGGTFLWLFAIAAVAMNVGGYWFSERIALRLAGARELDEREAPALFDIARDLADRAAIPMPRLHVMPGEQANAFATGRNRAHSSVALTDGLLTGCSADHVRAVIAHEFAHIRNHDILVSSVAAMIAGAISAVANVLQLSFLFGGDDEDGQGLLSSLAVMILAPIGAVLLQLAVSRQREYLADATAARFLGAGRPLAEALQAIHDRPAPDLPVVPATAPMYIVSPLSGGRAAHLFSTHPPVQERIRRLHAYDATLSMRTRSPATRGSVARGPA